MATNFVLLFINFSFLLVCIDVLDRYGVDPKLFCLLSYGAYTFVAEINYMPILGIWCMFCPDGLEATSITLFTGLINLSGNMSNYLGALLIWVFSFQRDNFAFVWQAVVL